MFHRRIAHSVDPGGCRRLPIYFEPRDRGSLAAALDAALAHAERVVKVRAGLDRVRRYSWDTAAVDTLAVYRSMHGDS